MVVEINQQSPLIFKQKNKMNKKLSKQLEERKKSICPICKKLTKLTTHHKDGNHFNNDKRNILFICENCHQKIHKIVSKKKQNFNSKIQKGSKNKKRLTKKLK